MRVLEPNQRLRSIATRRSLLPPPTEASDPRWERSWRHLCDAYAPAMRRYVSALLASSGWAGRCEQDAAEIVQEYLAGCFEKGWLGGNGDVIDCFRAYLQVQLRRFTISWLRRHDAARRGARVTGGDDGLETAPAASCDADAAMDAAVVVVAIERAMVTLRRGNADYADLIADLLRTDGSGSADIAALMGREPGQIAVLRHRARRRFARLFADELRSTVRHQGAFDALLARLEPYLP